MTPSLPIWILSALALAALIGVVVQALRRLSPPNVKLVSVHPERLGAGEQRLRVRLRLENPNPVPLPVLALTYRLWLEERPIAAGEAGAQPRVPARGSAELEALVSGDASDLLRALPRLALTPRPWRYRLEGRVAVLPRLRLSYRHSGEIDLKGLLRLAASLR